RPRLRGGPREQQGRQLPGLVTAVPHRARPRVAGVAVGEAAVTRQRLSSQGGNSLNATVAGSFPPETPLARRRAARAAAVLSQGGHSRISGWAFATPPETPLACRRAARAAT